MDNPKFPYYSGNINLVKVLGHVTIHDFVYAHKCPKLKTIETIRAIRNTDSPEEKRLLKQKLFSFTPSVFIDKGDKRRYSNIKYYTGLMQIDLDGIKNKKLARSLKDWVFEQDECVCSYLSPSFNVKALIRIQQPVDKQHYIRLWNAVADKYDETGYFDHATKNAVLPLFLSSDPFIRYRPFKEALPWFEEKEVVKKYTELNDHPPTSINLDSNENYYEKTTRILSNKINNITDNGHPQVRSAALILGSRVAAGYIDKITALNEIVYLIQNNGYLKKGTEGYISTARWGIEEGMKNPKYY